LLVVHPTGACLDSQSVKCTAAPGVRGYDAGKKANGRKRHILVDTLGPLLAVVVTTASVQDRDGARLLLGRPPGGCTKLREIWVDGGYAGQSVDWVAERFAFCLVVVLTPKQRQGYETVKEPNRIFPISALVDFSKLPMAKMPGNPSKRAIQCRFFRHIGPFWPDLPAVGRNTPAAPRSRASSASA
jgi:hypothetical protein